MIPALIVIGILLLLYLCFFLENRRFVIRHETICHANVKKPFTIVQVSDLHNNRFGNDQQKLLAAVSGVRPDLILITGDLFDRHRKNCAQQRVCICQKSGRDRAGVFCGRQP